MNYYYDPILGLQYNCIGDYFILDIEVLPQYTKEHWLKHMRQMGIQPIGFQSFGKIINITNYKL